MIEYSCDGEWVTAAWRGYEARAPLDWPDDPEYMNLNAKWDVLDLACFDATEELIFQMNSSGQEFDGKGERK